MEPNANESKLNELSEKIIGAAFEVSNILGMGFLEKVYENALNIELELRGLRAQQQTPLKVYYKDELVGDYFADILRLIFVSLSDRSREIQLELFSIQEKIKPANSLIKSPQRAQSSTIPVTTYDKAATSRNRTRMLRIARIFRDIFDHHASLFPISDNKPQRSQRTQIRIGKPCAFGVFCSVLTLFASCMMRIYTYPRASASSVQSVFYFTPPVLICVHPRLKFAEDFKPAFWYEKINNELERTQYELTLPEFVSVRIGSLFFSCSSAFRKAV